MGFFDIFKSKKEVDLDKQRREFLQSKGRITDGVILDNALAENGDEIVFYVYNIQGVDFESSEILTEDKLEDPLKYAPGAKIGVRFDPKNHGNSILD